MRADREAILAAVDLGALLEELTGRSAKQGRYPCPYPGHEQTGATPPVTVDGQRWCCHNGACGAGGSAVDALMVARGLSVGEALGELGRRVGLGHLSDGTHPRPEVVAEYKYVDEAAEVLFEVVRYVDKSFRQRRPDGAGGWTWRLGDTRRVLYRLPEVLAGVAAGRWVLVVEGEKDADRLHREGLVGTCNPGGAGKWRPEYAASLAGGKVAILPDSDTAGRAHAETVARSLRGVAERVVVVELPGLPLKGDVSDWLDAGHGVDELKKLIREAPVWEPPQTSSGEVTDDGAGVVCMSDVEPERVRFLWSGRIPRGKLTLLEGDPKTGKSTLALDIAARVSTGSPMPDGERLEGPATVVLLTAEDGLADTVRPRLDVADADVGKVYALESVPAYDGDGNWVGDRLPSIPDDLDSLEALVVRHEAALVIVDVLNAFMGSHVDGHRDSDVRRALMPLAKMAERTGAAVVAIRHLNKSGGVNPLYRGGGSIGIAGQARSILLAMGDPDDESEQRRVLAVTACNVAEPVPALGYRLVPDEEHRCAGVEWLGATAHTSASLLAQPHTDEDRSERDDAVALLRDLLAEGPVSAKLVKAEAREAGISEMTLRRAKGKLRVRSRKLGSASGVAAGGSPGWCWELSAEGDRLPTEGAQSSAGDHLPSLAGERGQAATEDVHPRESDHLPCSATGEQQGLDPGRHGANRVDPVPPGVPPEAVPPGRCERCGGAMYLPIAGRWIHSYCRTEKVSP